MTGPVPLLDANDELVGHLTSPAVAALADAGVPPEVIVWDGRVFVVDFDNDGRAGRPLRYVEAPAVHHVGADDRIE